MNTDKLIILPVILYFLISYWISAQNPLPHHADESYYWDIAKNVYERGRAEYDFVWKYKPELKQEMPNNQAGYWMPGISIIAQMPMRILGNELMNARLIVIISTALIILITYLIGKELYNKKTGFLAAIITMLVPGLLKYSIEFVSLNTAILFQLTAFYTYIKKKKTIAGLILAMCYIIRSDAIILTSFIFIYEIITTRKIKDALKIILPTAIFILAGANEISLKDNFLATDYNTLLYGIGEIENPGIIELITNKLQKGIEIIFALPNSITIIGLIILLTGKNKKILYLPYIYSTLIRIIFFTVVTVSQRHELLFIPLLIILISNKILKVKSDKIKIFITGMIITLLLIGNLQKYDELTEKRREVRNMIIGEFIKDRTNENDIIITQSPWELSHYSERKLIQSPYGDVNDLLTIKEKYNATAIFIESHEAEEREYYHLNFPIKKMIALRIREEDVDVNNPKILIAEINPFSQEILTQKYKEGYIFFGQLFFFE